VHKEIKEMMQLMEQRERREEQEIKETRVPLDLTPSREHKVKLVLKEL
jgi:hypothetical protein